MPSESILFDKRDGIARLRFNRPEAKNALTLAMCDRLVEVADELRADRRVRALLIEAAGPDFCTGADMGDLATMTGGTPADRAGLVRQSALTYSEGIFLSLATLDIPIVAAVRGYAVGAGFQFALMADLVVASENARFFAPMVNLAHSPDHGESCLLPRKVGEARAAQILLLGERLAAAEAEKWGIVNWVVPDGELEVKADEIATRLASLAPLAVRNTKALLRKSRSNDIASQFEAERDCVAECAASADFVEAIMAFTERRKPVFGG
ncbi:MAG: enoyl-CoA hydratase-related protein [Aromatoleum sp.]|jgi:2-(1,2-epoxy-1,2-dihydrophenyl)acetyl-CoA isomerase|uniref:enoyl-CoA hydratase/isomerase family protein n=1 Tax=Aromatoleum sp. TaxID=2307007 RepID=UPI0028955F78|nr:enoyl-CoA hydratase-related protein [Aromatoleum sp.]MDT3670180.1 enoyl-CoA hydratase-related protein [Aromatoleum sp.]